MNDIEKMRVTKLIRREFEVMVDRRCGYCPVRYFDEWRLTMHQVLPNQVLPNLFHWEVVIERGGEGGLCWKGRGESPGTAFEVALNKLTDDL